MSFSSLSSAWLFGLLVPLIVFYFLKLRRPRQLVPSLVLWRQAPSLHLVRVFCVAFPVPLKCHFVLIQPPADISHFQVWLEQPI